MSDCREREVAEEVFGAVTDKDRDEKFYRIFGKREPDMHEFIAPFEWDIAIVRFFCQRCGFLFEASEEIARMYVPASFKLPTKPSRREYVRVSCCILCGGEGEGIESRYMPVKNRLGS